MTKLEVIPNGIQVFVLTYDEGAYSDWTMGVLGVYATRRDGQDAAEKDAQQWAQERNASRSLDVVEPLPEEVAWNEEGADGAISGEVGDPTTYWDSRGYHVQPFRVGETT